MAVTGKRVHVADLKEEEAYKAGYALLLGDQCGARTILSVPMLKEPLGLVQSPRSQEVRPFTRSRSSLSNFAAQAVIAIEKRGFSTNARENGRRRQKLNQQLEQRVADQVGEIERMGRLRRFLPPQVADLIVASGTEKQLESHRGDHGTLLRPAWLHRVY